MGTEHIMDGNNRGNIKTGDRVLIVMKQDQPLPLHILSVALRKEIEEK